ncbi:protein kinase family protein [Thermogymnomonas acidicola]|nr:protein kinase family protein [Thermogymnomonas acidicola]
MRKSITGGKRSVRVDGEDEVARGEKNVIVVRASPGREVKEATARISGPTSAREREMRMLGPGVFYIPVVARKVGEYAVEISITYRDGSERHRAFTFIAREKGEAAPGSAEAEEEPLKPLPTQWPTSSQYAQAIQKPGFSINSRYQDLRSGTPVKNPNVRYSSYIHGSGNFGVVFKIDVSGRYYALKCFTRASGELNVRYREVSRYLRSRELPFLVEFHYLQEAIRVMSRPETYYPALRMSWIEGINLNRFIEQNLGKPRVLESAARTFIDQVYALQRNGIAHGDLSGDNILVSDGKMYFIDYDGMYVPAFRGKKAPEMGHENFQHPRRRYEYNERIDGFSSLVILLSLIAVAKDPSLWDYNDGDADRLLFTSRDFTAPGESELISRLISMGGKVKKLTQFLVKFLDEDPDWAGGSPQKVREAYR